MYQGGEGIEGGQYVRLDICTGYGKVNLLVGCMHWELLYIHHMINMFTWKGVSVCQTGCTLCMGKGGGVSKCWTYYMYMYWIQEGQSTAKIYALGVSMYMYIEDKQVYLEEASVC